jgi:hypothetical protein
VRPGKKFTVLIEQDEEGYFVATVPVRRGCHTQAKSLDTLTSVRLNSLGFSKSSYDMSSPHQGRIDSPKKAKIMCRDKTGCVSAGVLIFVSVAAFSSNF